MSRINGDHLATVEASALKRADKAARLAKAVAFKRANPDLGFDAVGRLFHVGAEQIKKAVRGNKT
jgi:hypothetical protein